MLLALVQPRKCTLSAGHFSLSCLAPGRMERAVILETHVGSDSRTAMSLVDTFLTVSERLEMNNASHNSWPQLAHSPAYLHPLHGGFSIPSLGHVYIIAQGMKTSFPFRTLGWFNYYPGRCLISGCWLDRCLLYFLIFLKSPMKIRCNQVIRKEK